MPQRLPLEMLERIVELSSPSDLLNFSITERTLGVLAERRLYRNLTFLTNPGKFHEELRVWISEKGTMCLQRSVAAQNALVKRPRRFEYVRSLSLNGRYRQFAKRYNRSNGTKYRSPSDLDDVIDTACLGRMTNLRVLDCTDLRVGTPFLRAIHTMKKLKTLSLTRCLLFTPGKLGTTNSTQSQTADLNHSAAKPVEIIGWQSYLENGWKVFHMSHSLHAARLLETFASKRPEINMITDLVIRLPWPGYHAGFTNALLGVLSSCLVATSVTIIPNRFTEEFAIELPEKSIPRLKYFSGPHTLAPTFVRGRPVDSIDLQCLGTSQGQKLDADILQFLRSSTVEVTELRLHCNLGLQCIHLDGAEWLTVINAVPDFTPSLRKLCLGTLSIVSNVDDPEYPEDLAMTTLSRLTSLVELHIDQSGVYDLRSSSWQDVTAIMHKALEHSLQDRGPCKRRDEIVNACSKACPSLRRITFGEGTGWGGCERLDDGRWDLFLSEEQDDFWEIDVAETAEGGFSKGSETYTAEFIKLVIPS